MQRFKCNLLKTDWYSALNEPQLVHFVPIDFVLLFTHLYFYSLMSSLFVVSSTWRYDVINIIF